ncbi:hypothetical protein [Paenibacillus chitinolyticus]|uniref:hypothetical protein n=1 Tax=Paenibacillus chitinolyticus TaxID=79263 RepID=UPI00366FE1C9
MDNSFAIYVRVGTQEQAEKVLSKRNAVCKKLFATRNCNRVAIVYKDVVSTNWRIDRFEKDLDEMSVLSY